jgi:hypothetical protein
MPKQLVVKKDVETMLSELTDMQRLYAEARLHGLSPLDSAKAAGFSHPSIQWHGYEKHPKIAPIISMANARSMERYQLSRDDIVSGFLDAVNSAGSSTELTAAWREIGKMLGHYAPEQHEHKVSVENMTLNRLETMSDQDLAALAEMDEFTLPRDHELVARYEVLDE